MRRKQQSQLNLDWEAVGFNTMVEVRDETRARVACGLKLQAFADELRPAMARCNNRIATLSRQVQALVAQLYQRHHPISDTAMIGLCAMCVFLGIAFAVAFLTSAVGNVMTLLNFGWDTATCVVVGLLGTALVTIVGQLAHARLVASHRLLESAVVVVISALMIWALIDFGRGRGDMTTLMDSEEQVQSFVEEAPEPHATSAAHQDQKGASAGSIRERFSDALTKLTIVSDIAVGLLLGALLGLCSDGDFAGWRRLGKEKRLMAKTEHELNELVATLEMANKRCAAGIVRAARFARPNHPPYLAPIIAFGLLTLGDLHGMLAQRGETIIREEVILLDVSGSMSRTAGSRTLFNELRQGIKELLRTEPPESRTWTLLISTDSFGAMPTIVKGWTPSTNGIFIDRLQQARKELVSTFEAKAGNLSPSASGTDIFGAIARAKILLEAEPNSARHVRELFLFSDGVNETSYNMPALLPTGAENMINLARTNRLIVPLAGVRVYVFGASTANLSPDAWTTIKAFWTAYFRAAGAELVAYSPETAVYRK